MRRVLLFLALVLSLVRLCAEEALQLDVSTDRELYLSYSANRIYIQGLVRAPVASTETQAVPVHSLCFVLDCSGSMAGPRLQALRQAMTRVLGSLRDQDLVSLISFGSETHTLLESSRRDEIRDPDALLSRLSAGGGSALYDALNQGAAQLRRQTGPGLFRHMILVTDGPPTKGPLDQEDFRKLAEAFASEGIRLSAIGLGEEFEEDCLQEMARSGGGRFHYSDTSARLEGLLLAEAKGPGELVGREVSVTFELKNDVDDVEAYGWSRPELDRNKVRFSLPAVFAGETSGFLVSAKFPANSYLSRGGLVRLEWTNPADGRRHKISKPVELIMEADARAVRKSINPAAFHLCIQALVSEGLEKAIVQYDRGDQKKVLRELRGIRDELESLHDEVDDPELVVGIRRLDQLLEELKTRGMKSADRKLLRSGFFNDFQLPLTRENPR